MSETADATYFQEHKDDPGEWGPPEKAPSSERRRLASMISVRFSPEEAAAVRDAAASAGESLSNFVRQAALMRSAGASPTVQLLTGSVTSQVLGPPQARFFVGAISAATRTVAYLAAPASADQLHGPGVFLEPVEGEQWRLQAPASA
jgi:hypothetical protein